MPHFSAMERCLYGLSFKKTSLLTANFNSLHFKYAYFFIWFLPKLNVLSTPRRRDPSLVNVVPTNCLKSSNPHRKLMVVVVFHKLPGQSCVDWNMCNAKTLEARFQTRTRYLQTVIHYQASQSTKDVIIPASTKDFIGHHSPLVSLQE